MIIADAFHPCFYENVRNLVCAESFNRGHVVSEVVCVRLFWCCPSSVHCLSVCRTVSGRFWRPRLSQDTYVGRLRWAEAARRSVERLYLTQVYVSSICRLFVVLWSNLVCLLWVVVKVSWICSIICYVKSLVVVCSCRIFELVCVVGFSSCRVYSQDVRSCTGSELMTGVVPKEYVSRELY